MANPKTKNVKKSKPKVWFDTKAYPGEESLCSGYGVYPNGKKCSGCSDCGGKPVSRKQLVERINKNHTTLQVGKKKVNVVKK